MDIARLSNTSVRWFNEEPHIAMISHSNFGSDTSAGSRKVREAVAILQKEYPDMAIDGEMQIGYALNKEQRDETDPFTRLKGLGCQHAHVPQPDECPLQASRCFSYSIRR